jgi:hypothetical protein
LVRTTPGVNTFDRAGSSAIILQVSYLRPQWSLLVVHTNGFGGGEACEPAACRELLMTVRGQFAVGGPIEQGVLWFRCLRQTTRVLGAVSAQLSSFPGSCKEVSSIQSRAPHAPDNGAVGASTRAQTAVPRPAR